MFLKLFLRSENGFYNLYLNEVKVKTPEKRLFDFTNKIYPKLILSEIKNSKFKNLNESIYYNIYSLAKDKISSDKFKYIDEVLKYVNTDLICYWEEQPKEIYSLQVKYWKSQLNKLEREDLYFNYTTDIMPIVQNVQSIKHLKEKIVNLDYISLSCLLMITQVTGSILLGYLYLTNKIKPENLFKNAYLHEIWQSEKWGIVEEENEKRNNNLKIFKKIYKLIKLNYENPK